MKIKKTILTAAILMAAVSLPAQNKSAGINISIWKDICTQPHDSTQTTYVNIGLLSTMNRLNGVGINALGSVVHGDMNGLQITGLANLAGGTMRGVQLAGISNISGDNTVGLSAAGLVNITGDKSQGVVISGLTALVMIILGALLYRKFGRNPWSGTADSQLRSKSVTRAIGWSVLIFLIAWIVLGLLGMALGYWWLTFVIAGASYFVIENFL